MSLWQQQHKEIQFVKDIQFVKEIQFVKDIQFAVQLFCSDKKLKKCLFDKWLVVRVVDYEPLAPHPMWV